MPADQRSRNLANSFTHHAQGTSQRGPCPFPGGEENPHATGKWGGLESALTAPEGAYASAV